MKTTEKFKQLNNNMYFIRLAAPSGTEMTARADWRAAQEPEEISGGFLPSVKYCRKVKVTV